MRATLKPWKLFFLINSYRLILPKKDKKRIEIYECSIEISTDNISYDLLSVNTNVITLNV